jgi:predicted Fe-Mo cluster-binding NifX family protein
MKIAIPVHEDHMAAVADFADTLMIFEIRDGREIKRDCMRFTTRVIPAMVGILSDTGVNVLICGAVSRPFAAMVVYSGIELVPFISGPIKDIINAYLSGNLADPRFFMPGHTKGMHWCSRRRCHRHGGINELNIGQRSMFTSEKKEKKNNAKS